MCQVFTFMSGKRGGSRERETEETPESDRGKSCSFFLRFFFFLLHQRKVVVRQLLVWKAGLMKTVIDEDSY